MFWQWNILASKCLDIKMQMSKRTASISCYEFLPSIILLTLLVLNMHNWSELQKKGCLQGLVSFLCHVLFNFKFSLCFLLEWCYVHLHTAPQVTWFFFFFYKFFLDFVVDGRSCLWLTEIFVSHFLVYCLACFYLQVHLFMSMAAILSGNMP